MSLPRRRTRGAGARDVSLEAAAVVDLSMMDSDDSDGDDGAPIPIAPRFAKTEDGCFQTLSTPLVASTFCEDTGLRNPNIKQIRVKVKWGFPVKEESGPTSRHAFARNEKIFAWDRGGLYKARVLKWKEGEDGVRFYVGFLGYKISHNRWLAPIEMIKDNPSSREYYCSFWGEGGGQQEEISSDKKPKVGMSGKNTEEVSGKRRNGKATQGEFRPEPVQSSSTVGSGTTPADEDDYEELRSRYLLPRVREKAELAGGITLRRQTRARVIDQKTKGFRMLRSRIDYLLRRNDHAEVYRLLCQLRDYELDPSRVPAAVQLRGDDEVAEVLDLTNEDGEDGSGRCTIDVDHYITDILLAIPKRDDRKISQMETPSNPLPEGAQSNAAVRRYSSNSDNPMTRRSNQSLETFSDSEDCGQDEGSAKKQQSPHLSSDAMEELETFVFEVIQTVCREAEAKNTREDGTNLSMLAAASSNTNRPQVPETLTSPNPPSIKHRAPDNTAFKGRDWSKVSWNDIPKPPGQRTIDDCRGFYVHRNPAVRSSAGQQWDDILNRHEFRNSHVHPSSRPQLQWESARAMTPFPQSAVGGTGPPLQYQSSQRNQAQHPATFGYNALASRSHLGGYAQPSLHAGLQHDFASLLSLVMSQPQRMVSQNQSVFPPIMHQQVESQPRLQLQQANLVPSSPTNRKKRALARIVTPETLDEKSGLDVKAPKRKRRRRKQKADLDGKVRRQLHSVSPSAAHRFAVEDFVFPSASSLRKVEGCNKASALTISPKREMCLLKRTSMQRESSKRDGELQSCNSSLNNPTFSIVPRWRVTPAATKPSNDATALRKDWNKQLKKRKEGNWMPSGHLNGKWKAPAWADLKNDTKVGIATNESKRKKCPGRNKTLLSQLQHLLTSFLAKMELKCGSGGESSRLDSLHDLVCPRYLSPDFKLLRAAHSALVDLLPDGDCEDWEVVAFARRYYNFWRPNECKVILMAESHGSTTLERAKNGPGLDFSLLHTYNGPREFLSLVYCLAYGENEALAGQVVDKSNKGTPQFWTFLAACARGVEYVAETKCTNKTTFTFPFAADLLKVGQLSVEERLEAKLGVLEELRRRGIWLLDASIFGWYISQPQVYSRSAVSNEVQRRAKERPPKSLKTPSLVLSWELFTKHLIRDVANEGHLKLLIPIGMEVESALTRERMEDAIKGKSAEARVTETFPAPNAWIPGGYGPFHAKLAKMVQEATESASQS